MTAEAVPPYSAGTLTEVEVQVLAFERQWWRYAGAKEQAVRELFDMSATRYYQVLNALIDTPAALAADPANWISQPLIDLSVAPTLTSSGLRPRHLDLRPFAVTGRDTWVLPGGLSRVAMKEGSLIVNSSQGGGSKDTWVLVDE